MFFLGMACALQTMNLHWQIDWQSQSNLLRGSYVSKELITRPAKLDGILKKKIGALDSEIQVIFMILMGISAYECHDGNDGTHLLFILQTES